MVGRVGAPRDLLQRYARLAALLACLIFTWGLTDVRLAPLVVEPSVPALPSDVTQRGGQLELVVHQVDEARCAGTLAAACSAQPLAGAKLRVYWQRGRHLYEAGRGSTDASGRLSLGELPQGVLWILADAPGRARVSTQLSLDAAPRQLTLGLLPARQVLVTVLDDEGQPLGDATVLVTDADPLPHGALTGAGGAVTVGRLGQGPYTVKVSARGYESLTEQRVDASVTFRLRRLGRLTVHVRLPTGEPAADAEVLIVGTSLWPLRRTQTDAQGSALISGLLAGSYELRATRGTLVSATHSGLELERGQEQELTLQLEPGRQVRALVTDGDEPNAVVVPNADVTLSTEGLSSFPLRGRTGGDGMVVLGPLPPGPATLGASAPDFVPSPVVSVPEVLDGEPLRVALLRGGTLRGEVVDAKGRPVDGASVEIIGTDLHGLPVSETPELLAYRARHFQWALPGAPALIPAGELGVMPGPVPPIPRPNEPAPLSVSGLALDTSALEAPPEPWITRFDGRFVARPLTPGRLRALVRHPDYVEGLSEPVNLAPGGSAEVKLVLLEGGKLEGRVLDADGRPAPGVRVQVTALRGSVERATETASDGSFAFTAVPAEVWLNVARRDDPLRPVLRRALELEEGALTRVELTLPREREPVRVSVLDEAGAPLGAAQVTLLSLDPETPRRETLFTGEAGFVEFVDARELPARLLVDAPGYAPLAENVAAAPELLTLTLRRGVLVQGRVTELRGRRALAGASVTLLVEGRRLFTQTDDEGSYQLRDVPPGPVELSVSHPERASATLSATVTPTGRADRPFELPSVDLEEGGDVEGRVVDAEGAPVRGARVAVGRVPAYLPAGALPPGMVLSGGDGRFTLRRVAPGTQRLEAFAAGVGRAAISAEVSAGRSRGGLELRLRAEGDETDTGGRASVAITLGEQLGAEGIELVVLEVAPGSEAERAGLRAKDVLLGVDGADLESLSDARARLSGPGGTDVVLELEREGRALKLRVARELVRR